MKSLNFHTEISILTFLLFWTVAQFSLFCHSEELKDVQVKIIKEAKKPCNDDPSRMAERGNIENLILFKKTPSFLCLLPMYVLDIPLEPLSISGIILQVIIWKFIMLDD